MYERIGFEGRRPSPFSWRIRYALTHKGADVEYLPTRFADVGTIEKLSGQKLVPIIVDGSRVIHDSWNIARFLEERYPDKPTLFGELIIMIVYLPILATMVPRLRLAF
jgi:glutathione S-transferase